MAIQEIETFDWCKRVILCEIEEFCQITVWKSYDFAFSPKNFMGN